MATDHMTLDAAQSLARARQATRLVDFGDDSLPERFAQAVALINQ